MKVKCIKDVIMQPTDRVAFIEGKIYEAKDTGEVITAMNEQNNFHYISDQHNYRWFQEYFTVVE